MDEMILIPKAEVPQDVAFYKNQLTGNAWLHEGGKTAAAKKRILEDANLTDEEAVARVRPLSRKLRKINKRLRQLPPSGGGTEEPEGEDGSSDLVTSRLEKWLQRLAKTIEGPPKKKKPPVPPRPRPPPPPLDEEEEDEEEEEFLLPTPPPSSLKQAALRGALGKLAGPSSGTPKTSKRSPIGLRPRPIKPKTPRRLATHWQTFKG